MTKPYKQKQKRKGRLDIPWKRTTRITQNENKRFYSLDSFFNAMVNEYKMKVEGNPILPYGLNFLIIYKINIDGLPQVETFEYFPETVEQQTVAAIEEVMKGQVGVSACERRFSSTFNAVLVNLFPVNGIETLIFQGSCCEGEFRVKAFDVIRDEDLNIVDLIETERMKKFYAMYSYLDPDLQAEIERRKKAMSSP